MNNIRLMKEKAGAVQAIVSKIASMEDAILYTVDIIRQQGGKTVAATIPETKDIKLLKTLCTDAGIVLLDFPLRQHGDEIHTALTPVDWGIAETGTLVIDSSSEDVRIATMLSETHVALLPASKIKPDAESLENEINNLLQNNRPVYYSFITGASRTADIERVLAVGVHGPQELHILIMEDN